MAIATYLQCFESTLSSYTGEDPLDAWDKFVQYVQQTLPAGGSDGMSVVLDRLVETFLNVDRYSNDIRYVNYCIKWASYSSDPIVLYSYIYSKGVGSRTAALYVAWAQQFERRGLNEQADAVYQKAMENQAQPADTVLHEYRQFQTRTGSQTSGSAGGRTPLQNSHLTNQMSSHREPVAQMKASVDCLSKPHNTIVFVSRSETSGMISSTQGSSVQIVSEYIKDELVCEGSELCFEEVRAKKYFREKQENMHREIKEKISEVQEKFLSLKSVFEEADQDLGTSGTSTSQPSSQRHLSVVEPAASLNFNPTQQTFGRPGPSDHLNSRCSLSLRLHTQETSTASDLPQQPKHARPVDTHPLSVQHPSVWPDSAIHLPKSALASVFPLQTTVGQTNQSLHRPACIPGGNLDLPEHQDDQHQPSSWGYCQTQEHNTTQRNVSQLPEPEEKLDVSQGATANLSHITPNNSLGFVQATPSRVLPSPTVNTQEALDVIMDMFKAPTLLEDPFNNTSMLHAAEEELPRNEPPKTTPFTIFQDDTDKENGSAAAPSAFEKSKSIRALAELPVSKPDKTNATPPDLIPDESTMWGARYNSLNSLAACPNSTTDFAMSAQFVSTPFTHKTPVSSNFFHDRENNCDGGDADDDAFIRRQPKKLSPIMEQSPCEEKLSETAVSQLVHSSAKQGTIVGEGLASAQHCLTTSSITMVQPPPPAVLSFRDQTLCPTSASSTTEPDWEVYRSPGQPYKQASLLLEQPGSSLRPRMEPFIIMEDKLGSEVQKPADDVPMSPECAVKPDWLAIRSPEVTVKPDMDAFLSPRRPGTMDVPMSPECAVKPDWLAIRSPEVTIKPDLDAFLSPRRPGNVDVPMSPAQPQLFADIPMSPVQASQDEPMLSPDKGLRSMNMTPPRAARIGTVQLVPDPWDSDLISHLLSTLTVPVSSHPRCFTWQCDVPSITPKMTLSMGRASLRVDCILGEGAFATVYQATDPTTSEKVVLKVQKPANPWEFYINIQLDARLQPDVRHLYSSVRSAHLFNNGSVLLAELHNYGTLLNAVNSYKTLADKVMPQPLVMYFTICILHMVEQLHSVHIIHADVKPDNFLLGERFMDNKGFDSESVDHGLVLIDLGQSIDMELFPQGTAFTAKCLTSGFQCTEMLSGKPWNYQTDYFGIAGTVHCMLFGTYMQVRDEGGVWKTNAVFRRNPHSDLWLEFFHTLLNVPDCSSPTILRSLRSKLTSVLQQNYSSKLSTLKSRLVVLLLESRRAARR
ncbi:hypothetical protein Q5P01_004581 [Channa striata]|uniref:Mitotic checkpoint serine/threonine-protein kinase BUB1 n=1 Tax=Channa striata TaxID=64152 RepID=A0AA88NEI5_CHASR|nr:hypothetical protein Q5P01_004581 [Channa striata]